MAVMVASLLIFFQLIEKASRHVNARPEHDAVGKLSRFSELNKRLKRPKRSAVAGMKPNQFAHRFLEGYCQY
ncbi:hypothetical protein PUV47_07530 [Pseudovibrio exalbescens]|uniref:hypothetical protein n=1 Tax=Pseudovibrio exalbescens TaxID=197461 RepID=UPI00236503FE|nr:hypothetical protein [Pseudovibrio exalbescens]MDD7909766.1 hypothetical protein [Pseudovibrio exalbescens]